MKFSYNWLQSYFKQKLPRPEKLAELLALHAFEVESIVKVKKPSDFLMDIKVLANRMPDASGHMVMARECGAILGFRPYFPADKIKTNKKIKTGDFVKLQVKEPSLCPRYIGLLMRGIKVGESPKWLKDRLIAVGQKPINNIVDTANYVMLETSQPLHAFDLQKIGGSTIVVRRAAQGEKIRTLDGRDFTLKSSDLIIADSSVPMAIAGIKGGDSTGIHRGTTDIVIEAAVFEPSGIRKTSRSLNLRTDASVRFEHGLSLFLPEMAMLRAAALMKQVAGGEIASTAVDSLKKKPVLAAVQLHDGDFLHKTGKDVSLEDATRILKSLGFDVSRPVKNRLSVTAPLERTDVSTKEDVIEEIGRMYGYEKVPPRVPAEALTLPERNDEYFYSEKIRDIMAGLGFTEVYNYSFSDVKSESLKLKNPIADGREYLRQDLVTGLRQNVVFNLRHFSSVRIFEIGKIFFGKADGVGERITVSAAVGYKDKRKEKDVFFELKGAAESVLERLGISDLWFDDEEGRVAKVSSGNELLGFIDEDSFELDLAKIIEKAEEDLAHKPVSRYPAITRDLSLFVPADTRMVKITDVIENTAGPLLIDTDLFDTYEQENGETKSLAFHLIFQSEEKTLTDKEVNGIMEKIITALEENNIEWNVRKQ